MQPEQSTKQQFNAIPYVVTAVVVLSIGLFAWFAFEVVKSADTQNRSADLRDQAQVAATHNVRLAEDKLHQAIAAAEREQNVSSLAGSLIDLSDLLVKQFRYDEAASQLQQAIKTLQSKTAPTQHERRLQTRLLLTATARLAHIRKEQKRPTEATSLYRFVLDHPQKSELSSSDMDDVSAEYAKLLAHVGKHAESTAVLSRSDVLVEGKIVMVQANKALDSGLIREAKRLFGISLERVRTMPSFTCQNLFKLALCDLALGNHDEAKKRALDAFNQSRALGNSTGDAWIRNQNACMVAVVNQVLSKRSQPDDELKTLTMENPEVCLDTLRRTVQALTSNNRTEEAANLCATTSALLHDDYPTAVGTLQVLAQSAGQRQDFTSAENFFERAWSIATKNGSSNLELATICAGRASNYVGMKQHKKALEQCDMAVKYFNLANNSGGAQLVQRTRAQIYIDAHEYAKAVSVLEQLAIKLQTTNSKSKDYPIVCTQLGNAYRELGQYSKAEDAYLKAKAAYEKIPGAEPQLADLLLFDLCDDRLPHVDQHVDAYCHQCLAIYERLNNEPFALVASERLARFMIAKQRTAEAVQTLETAVNRAQQVGLDSEELAAGLQQLSELNWKQNNRDLAISRAEEAIDLYKRGLTPDHAIGVTATLADYRYEMRQLDKAETAYRDAIEMARRSDKSDLEFSLQARLVTCLDMQNKSTESNEVAKRALKTANQLRPPFSLGTGQAAASLAQHFERITDYKSADPLFQKAMVAYKTNHVAGSTMNQLLANVVAHYAAQGRHTTADELRKKI